MKRYLLVFFLLALGFANAQTSQVKPKKYPSLLWEISGKGLAKPSYLFGTMHVSSKLAFHLSDSFYIGIRNADVVALETNPETWQQELRKYESMEDAYRELYAGSRYQLMPQDYLRKSTLLVDKYESLIERSLSSRPVIINNLLYRSNSDEASDFEEDTYLDLHIFQTGKRWGKKVCSVENFDESMRLTTEAYVDGMKDEKKKTNYDYNPDYSYDKLETAYRTGNLDLLDTINQINQQSAAFSEKFLYRRNEIQAASIDSILKTKATLFVGVGAAHLPGQRGVIELLRKMGYKLRPIKMGERNSRYKDEVDKVKVAVPIKKQVAEDGFFKVDMPGELFPNNIYGSVKQFQYADMANGSYYMITRIPTNSGLWGMTTTDVLRQVDSLLYENIPGKILIKKSVVRNGYQGFDIVNRTRRGDYQRNTIFVTPFEVLIFKVSGTGEYVKTATEVNRFFTSIELKEYPTNWKAFSPNYGGFEVVMPHEPFVYNENDALRYLAQDKKTGNNFQIHRTSIHNYDFAEEDSFDLNLMEESFASSEFIDKTISRKHTIQNGYPALDVQYLHKDGSASQVRFLLKGPHYYTLVANGRKVDEQMRQFFSSFAIKPFVYKESLTQADTSLCFTVSSPVLLEKKKKAEPAFDVKELYKDAYKDKDESLVDNGIYKERLVKDDSTGERIYVTFYNAPAYYYEADSTQWLSTDLNTKREGWIVRSQKIYELPGAMRVNEYIISDTNSSRALWCKQFIKKGLWYWVATETDTSALQSPFLTQFFQTFRPADTLQSINPFERKASVFFADFFSTDSVRHKKAVMNISSMKFHGNDLEPLKKAIQSLSWKEKQYLSTKKELIWQLGTLSDKTVSDYLKQLYIAAGDTLELQHAVLGSLLSQQTSYAYTTFKDIILNEPPVLEVESSQYGSSNRNYYNSNLYRNYTTVVDYSHEDGSFFQILSDSLKLSAGIIKDFLPLVNIDDYEQPMLQLMEELVDSNYLKAADYEMYFTKFLMEAKQVWKKQSIGEKNKSIVAAQQKEDDKSSDRGRNQQSNGNYQLNLYTTLLMPFWNSHTSVPTFIQQLLTSTDNKLKFHTMQLLLRHGKAVPDTLINYFASKDEYRYDLYFNLKELNKLSLFPKAFSEVDQMVRAKLIAYNEYENVDTLQLLNKVAVEHMGQKGFLYVYQYKEQKDDASWKFATVGLVPSDGTSFELELNDSTSHSYNKYDFTSLSSTKIEEDKPLAEQVQKLVKQMLYAKRKSAAMFYQSENDYERMLFRYR